MNMRKQAYSLTAVGVAVYFNAKRGDFSRGVFSNQVSPQKKYFSTASKKTTTSKFLAEQEKIGVQAEQIYSTVKKSAAIFIKATGKIGPSQAHWPVTSVFLDLIIKLGLSQNCRGGVIIDSHGTEHYLEADDSSAVLEIYKSRLETLCERMSEKIKKGDLFVTFSAGSLNTFWDSKDTNDTLKNAISSPSIDYGGATSAETGILQYFASAFNGMINPKRTGYQLALVASVGINWQIKQKFPTIETVNISHSWGGPSIVQEYAYSLAVLIDELEKSGMPLVLPIDTLLLVDPRFIATPKQALAFASQIAFLRSWGVKVITIQDTHPTKGFGAIDGQSGVKFTVAPIAQKGIVIVDQAYNVYKGHAIANHLKLIKEILDNLTENP